MALAITPTTLETVTGRFVDLVDPDPKDICIEDIAWSLSRLARFNGHTINKLPYSVAQHSLVVAYETVRLCQIEIGYERDLTPRETARWMLLGLLHDASEAYTGDVSGPLKKIPELRPVIKKIEHKIQDAIYKALGINPPSELEEKIVKMGDVLAQRIEAYNFMVSRGNGWSESPSVSIVKLQEFEMPKEAIEVYQDFLDLFESETANLSL
jgi:5'-deoxynucleotidase YfbR-like HD superfamily hydrolase